jgi:predicted glycosyltransferase
MLTETTHTPQENRRLNSAMNSKTSIQALTPGPRPAKIERCPAACAKGKIWIDLDNSPHVPFFAPIIEELQKRNYSVVVTARDCFQVRELADLFHLNYKLIGHHSGKSKLRKVAGLCFRALELIPTILREKPDLAVSHCSRSQLIASTFCRIPSFFLGDYEFATAWVFIYPTWHMRPEVIPDGRLPRSPSRNLKYPGIKEDVYVPRFVPDPSIRSQLGLQEQDVVVTMRPPAREAHYHNPQSDELFEAAVEFLCKRPELKLVVLPRNEKQAMWLRERWPDLFSDGKMRIPEKIVDGLNLIWHSDFVISGGGTMNREAASLNVPVYSIFRGKIGAVDQYLSKTGRLVLLQNVEDLQTKILPVRKERPTRPQDRHSPALSRIVEQMVASMESQHVPSGGMEVASERSAVGR